MVVVVVVVVVVSFTLFTVRNGTTFRELFVVL
jgi:hypothetical protein